MRKHNKVSIEQFIALESGEFIQIEPVILDIDLIDCPTFEEIVAESN